MSRNYFYSTFASSLSPPPPSFSPFLSWCRWHRSKGRKVASHKLNLLVTIHSWPKNQVCSSPRLLENLLNLRTQRNRKFLSFEDIRITQHPGCIHHAISAQRSRFVSFRTLFATLIYSSTRSASLSSHRPTRSLLNLSVSVESCTVVRTTV